MKRGKWVFCAIAGLLALLLVGMPAGGTEADELEAKLEQLQEEEEAIQEEIAQLEGIVSENAQQIGQMVANKSAIDQQINLLYAQIQNVNDQIQACAQLIADRQEVLDAEQAKLNELSQRYKVRIRAMEESGDMVYWEVLFGSKDLMDFLDRVEMVQEIARADQKRLSQLHDSATAVANAKAAVECEKDRIEEAKLLLEETHQQLEEKRLASEELLRSLLATGEQYKQLLEEAESREEELMHQIAQTQDAYDEAKYQQWLESQKPVSRPDSGGAWLCPVSSYVLTSPFGMRLHPILGIERMHNGIDMGCPAMTEIYATRGGVVSVADYQADGAGNYVQIDHGDGYRSIYMHMTYYVVQAGTYVQQGQLIGYVGNTGLSKGAHLHFGISWQGTYVNPLEYIT